MKDYRFVSFPDKQKKMSVLVILGMIKQGISANQIVKLAINYDNLDPLLKEALLRYITPKTLLTEEFLFVYEINRINFNLFGIPKQISLQTAAMILGFLLISKCYCFNFLFVGLCLRFY